MRSRSFRSTYTWALREETTPCHDGERIYYELDLTPLPQDHLFGITHFTSMSPNYFALCPGTPVY